MRDPTARSRLRAKTGALFCNMSEMKPCKVPPVGTKSPSQVIHHLAQLPEAHSPRTLYLLQDPDTGPPQKMADSPKKLPPEFLLGRIPVNCHDG